MPRPTEGRRLSWPDKQPVPLDFVLTDKHRQKQQYSGYFRPQVKGTSHTRARVRATLALGAIVVRVESRRQHYGGDCGLFGAQPTPVWSCKQLSRVAIHCTAHCLQTELVRISSRLIYSYSVLRCHYIKRHDKALLCSLKKTSSSPQVNYGPCKLQSMTPLQTILRLL